SLVSKRASAMQKACEANPSTMAAIIGLENEIVEQVCAGIEAIVVPANYNTTGQIVISGSHEGIDLAIEKLKAEGAKRALKLPVGGAFHSPLMEPAREELAAAIAAAPIAIPRCPIYQNVDAYPQTDIDVIRQNLVAQLTSPVRWTQIVQNLLNDGATQFIEVGPGKVLQGLVKKVDRSAEVMSAEI
ncbi:MAG: ACP S-malonyltransferase, partial [Bacteroidetes bacterium]|nr:ACP S-malonyltransferase [Bacteroidota bacterium]